MAAPGIVTGPTPSAIVDALHANDRAASHLGIEMEHVSDDEVVLGLSIAEWMLNGHRVLHGGVSFWLGDTAFAYLLAAGETPSLTRQAEITFVAPVRQGTRVHARARTTAKYGRNSIVDVAVTDDEGSVVACMRVHGSTLPRLS